MKAKWLRLTVAGVLCLPGVVVLTPAWSASTASCDVFSNTPFYASSYLGVGGTGGRSNCSSTVSLQVKLKYDRFGPDGEVASNGGRVTNATWTVYGCAGRQSYYVNSSTDSGQVSGSANRTISC